MRSFYSTNEGKVSNKINYVIPSKVNCFLNPNNDIKYGRHFGKWKCLNCENKWRSAYTWLSITFCFNNKNICSDKIYQEESNLDSKKIKWVFSGSKLKDNDFLLQKCKKCTNNNVKVISYSNLEVVSHIDIVKPHRSDLCSKCLKGHPCKW